MAGILQKIVQKEIDFTAPETIKGSCLNHRQQTPSCEICVSVCPAGARSEPGGKVNESRCIDCGLCTAVCPSRAITPSGRWARMIKSQLNKPRESYLIGCAEAELGDLQPTCLCRMPWELFAYLALLAPVTVLAGMCKNCAKPEAKPLLDASLARTRIFLGEEEFSKRITLADDVENLPEDPGVPRREALSRAFHELGRSVGSALKPDDKTEDPMLLRKLLLRQVQKQDEIPVFQWLTPTLTESCWGCGVCEKVCPHGAIKIYTAEDGKHYFLHFANLCTGCGLCQKACPERAIREFTFQPLKKERRFLATAIRADRCSVCGGPIRPGSAQTKCAHCISKEKKAAAAPKPTLGVDSARSDKS